MDTPRIANPAADSFRRSQDRWATTRSVMGQSAGGVALGALMCIAVKGLGYDLGTRFMTDDGHWVVVQTQDGRWIHDANCPGCDSNQASHYGR